MDLTDERINVDDQPLIARSGARRPRPLHGLGEHAIELAYMPEREGPQERPKRRWRRDPMPQDRRGLARAQHVAVLDAVRTERHRTDHRHHLATRIRGPRAHTEIHTRIHERLDPQSPGKQRRQHHARVRDHPLIIKDDRRRVVHHEGDLLRRAATGAICRYQALLGRSLHPITRTNRGIES